MANNILVAQSGGPTCAINASLSGVIQEAMRQEKIGAVYGALNGIQGIMDRRIIRLDSQMHSEGDFQLLESTPAMALGSCRYRLPEYSVAPDVYKLIAGVMQDLEIGYFFYIGGNDSMDTAHKLGVFFAEEGIDIKVMGIPKTIDNDLPCTDHTPGFGSAAKYIATSILEIIRDTQVYNLPSVTIVEIMGRNAGWLTAASVLPHVVGEKAPHLVYLPEVPFDPDQFIEDIKAAQLEHKAVLVAVSEGVKTAEGRYVAESVQDETVDAFGHKYLSGIGKYLERYVLEKLGCKVRSVELSVLQRCAAHIQSACDIEEARLLGAGAVQRALAGETGRMIALVRTSNDPYAVELGTFPLEEAANKERKGPAEWILPGNKDLSQEAYDYLLPLIAGERSCPVQAGMPVHFHFDKPPLEF